jgi:hypothetical protein
MPVYNGETYLERSLSAIAASSRKPDEVIVVDDGSTDQTAALARRFGARLVVLADGPRGPATARNSGALEARGDILVFLDADVAVHASTLERIATYFENNPDVAALFGSYDDQISEQSQVSCYKNLLHHFTHQNSRRDAATFWAGCGAVRRNAFRKCGGFDERFRRPSIEDIELGMRLNASDHRVWSCPDVQASHLKRWTLRSLICTDVFCRAVPWSGLILRSGVLPNDLNTSRSSRFSAVAAWSLTMFLAVSPWVPGALVGLVPAIMVLVIGNARLLSFFYRYGGIRLIATGAGLHLLYYLYSSLTFTIIGINHMISQSEIVPWGLHLQQLPEAE